MKKLLALLLALAMIFALASCANPSSKTEEPAEEPAEEAPAEEEPAEEAEEPAEEAAEEEPAEEEAAEDDGAAEGWPEKTINVYITHGAGGDTDYMARQLSTALEGELGVSVVCSNVTGSNGATCMQQYGMQSGENIVVPADSPYNSLQELIDASKENPGQIKFGISTGGGVYIASCVMANLGGAEFNMIDAGDAATRLTALLGGEIDATSLPYSNAADYIEKGEMKSLCTCLSKAPDLIPDQPSASEVIPEMIVDTEYVLLAPKGTPASIVKAMNDAILKVTGTDEWKTIVNDYCFQNPYVLNVEDTIANLDAQRELFLSYKPFL